MADLSEAFTIFIYLIFFPCFEIQHSSFITTNLIIICLVFVFSICAFILYLLGIFVDKKKMNDCVVVITSKTTVNFI